MELMVWFLPQWHLALTVPLAAVACSALPALTASQPLAPIGRPAKDNEDLQ
jgi:hypothetical protein